MSMSKFQDKDIFEMFARANPQQFRMYMENYTKLIPTRYLLKSNTPLSTPPVFKVGRI